MKQVYSGLLILLASASGCDDVALDDQGDQSSAAKLDDIDQGYEEEEVVIPKSDIQCRNRYGGWAALSVRSPGDWGYPMWMDGVVQGTCDELMRKIGKEVRATKRNGRRYRVTPRAVALDNGEINRTCNVRDEIYVQVILPKSVFGQDIVLEDASLEGFDQLSEQDVSQLDAYNGEIALPAEIKDICAWEGERNEFEVERWQIDCKNNWSNSIQLTYRQSKGLFSISYLWKEVFNKEHFKCPDLTEPTYTAATTTGTYVTVQQEWDKCFRTIREYTDLTIDEINIGVESRTPFKVRHLYSEDKREVPLDVCTLGNTDEPTESDEAY